MVFNVKSPEESFDISKQSLRFRYAEAFKPLPDAYQTLLLDIMRGDQTLFVRADEVEASWKFYMPLLEDRPPVHPYPAGTWGPTEADALVGRDGASWTN